MSIKQQRNRTRSVTEHKKRCNKGRLKMRTDPTLRKILWNPATTQKIRESDNCNALRENHNNKINPRKKADQLNNPNADQQNNSSTD